MSSIQGILIIVHTIAFSRGQIKAIFAAGARSCIYACNAPYIGKIAWVAYNESGIPSIINYSDGELAACKIVIALAIDKYGFITCQAYAEISAKHASFSAG